MRQSQPSITGDSEAVRYNVDEHGVATLALNRPDARNAIDDEMASGLLAAFQRAELDPTVRCVVLTSTHDSVFSAGGNLKGMAATESTIAKYERNASFPSLTQAMMGLKVPVLCALNGHALAGGFGLAIACDLIIAKAGVRIGTPEINVGVFPFMISALMQRNLPRKRMAELILLGEQMTIEEAKELNIINRVVPPDLFDETVRDWSRRLASKSPLMIKLGKRALFEMQDQPLMQALSQLSHYLTLAQCTEDMKEGAAAFVEKRTPVWKGA
jgi:enoyl-CoA hydratase/carnithine racemase